jgi:hypothetical protein
MSEILECILMKKKQQQHCDCLCAPWVSSGASLVAHPVFIVHRTDQHGYRTSSVVGSFSDEAVRHLHNHSDAPRRKKILNPPRLILGCESFELAEITSPEVVKGAPLVPV